MTRLVEDTFKEKNVTRTFRWINLTRLNEKNEKWASVLLAGLLPPPLRMHNKFTVLSVIVIITSIINIVIITRSALQFTSIKIMTQNNSVYL